MVDKINAFLASIGLSPTAFAVEQYAVVPMGCDTWTFSPSHLFENIKEALGRYV